MTTLTVAVVQAAYVLMDRGATLADQAVVVPSEATDRLGTAARQAGVYLVIGVDEREATGSTIYNTLLYFDANGNLAGKHRKLMPTGPERTVWGMGDGSMLDTRSRRISPTGTGCGGPIRTTLSGSSPATR